MNLPHFKSGDPEAQLEKAEVGSWPSHCTTLPFDDDDDGRTDLWSIWYQTLDWLCPLILARGVFTAPSRSETGKLGWVCQSLFA